MDFDLNAIKQELKPLASGGSMNDIYRLLFYIGLLKYSTWSLLSKTHNTANKVATKPKLNRLVELGYIDSKVNIFIPNKMTFEILKRIKIGKKRINVDLLPNIPEGYGSVNELNNSEVFVQALNMEDYYCLLYPTFDYVRPDALLILKQGSKYRLTFLEIEKPKSNWDEYLDQKRINYLKLSKDIQVYDYWCDIAPLLKLPAPDLSEFKFTVTIVSKIKKDWGDGFVFIDKL
jgi:hypothetical protein